MHEYKKIGEAWLLQGKYGRSFEYKNIGSKASEGIDDLLTLKISDDHIEWPFGQFGNKSNEFNRIAQAQRVQFK